MGESFCAQAERNARRRRLTGINPCFVTMSHSPAHPEHAVHSDQGTKIIHALTICRPAAELYAALVDRAIFTEVIPTPGRLNWSSPTDFEFFTGDAVVTIGCIINRTPNELVAWQTNPAGRFPHAGTIRFAPAPADEGTEVTVQIEYEAAMADKFAKLFGRDPGNHVKQVLRRFKALMEAGEIPTIVGQAAGSPQKENRP